jgi:hypothetical protein
MKKSTLEPSVHMCIRGYDVCRSPPPACQYIGGVPPPAPQNAERNATAQDSCRAGNDCTAHCTFSLSHTQATERQLLSLSPTFCVFLNCRSVHAKRYNFYTFFRIDFTLKSTKTISFRWTGTWLIQHSHFNFLSPDYFIVFHF